MCTCSKVNFPANVFHEITGITDALKKNARDQNEQTMVESGVLLHAIVIAIKVAPTGKGRCFVR